MRTSIDIPDELMAEIRAELGARGMTFREAVIEGLRRTLLQPRSEQGFELRDASFEGIIGFAPGFGADDVTDAIRADAEARMVADDQGDYEP